MRLIRKLLILAVLTALAIFIARRWSGTPPEPVSEETKTSLSPEETKRLLEQALGQPRETVRFQFEPSAADPAAMPALPPPGLAAANPPAPPPPSPQQQPPSLALEEPPAPATPADDLKMALENRKMAVRSLKAALDRVGGIVKQLPASSQTTPTAPIPAAGTGMGLPHPPSPSPVPTPAPAAPAPVLPPPTSPIPVTP